MSHPVGSPREERKVEVEEESTTYCFNIFPGFLEVEAFKLNKFMQLSMAIQNALTDSNNLWQIFFTNLNSLNSMVWPRRLSFIYFKIGVFSFQQLFLSQATKMLLSLLWWWVFDPWNTNCNKRLFFCLKQLLELSLMLRKTVLNFEQF